MDIIDKNVPIIQELERQSTQEIVPNFGATVSEILNDAQQQYIDSTPQFRHRVPKAAKRIQSELLDSLKEKLRPCFDNQRRKVLENMTAAKEEFKKSLKKLTTRTKETISLIQDTEENLDPNNFQVKAELQTLRHNNKLQGFNELTQALIVEGFENEKQHIDEYSADLKNTCDEKVAACLKTLSDELVTKITYISGENIQAFLRKVTAELPTDLAERMTEQYENEISRQNEVL